MHVRVLLSRYRAYNPCQACNGARLKPEALQWRVGSAGRADAALACDASTPATDRTAHRAAIAVRACPA